MISSQQERRGAASSAIRGGTQPSAAQGRLLAAGIEILAEVGLDAGLGRLSFEDAIKRSGLSRATAYRGWPTREAFVNAVIVELAKGLRLSTGFLREVPAIVADLIGDGSTLSTPQGRRDMTVDLARVLAKGDFESISQSPDWRTYTALSAAYPSFASPELRANVAEAMRASDRHRIEDRAEQYAQYVAAAGYRLRAPLSGPSGFRQMSEAAGALFTGFLIRAQYDAGATAETMRLRAFDMSAPRLWSPQSFASTSLFFEHVEPDPGIVWDEARISDLLLTDFANPI